MKNEIEDRQEKTAPTPRSRSRRFLHRVQGLPVAVALVLAGAVPLAMAQGGEPGGGQEKIGKGVLEAARKPQGANVVIALAHPAESKRAKPRLRELRAEIAVMQRDVLSGVNAFEYRARRTYTAVPALAGKVLTESGLAKLAAHPHVRKIDLDVGGTGSLANSVPVIGADGRHALGNTGSGVVVAIIDSGLDTDHDDLTDDLLLEECFLDDDGSIDGFGRCPNGSDRQSGAGAAEDDAGHGTHVTGIVTSNGTQSSVGAAPDAGIVALKVTAGPTFSGVFAFFSEVVAALDFIINNPQHGVQVINMSIGTFALFTGDCDNSTAFNMAGAAAINTLRTNGVIAFASAGNDSAGTHMTSPACLSNVVSVGATDNADNVAAFSNSNASTDVFAPGVGVVSAALANSTTTASGTSMASPHAAGCAALLIQSGDAVTPNQIETRLETSGVSVTDPTNGLSFPRIDCSPGGSATGIPTLSEWGMALLVAALLLGMWMLRRQRIGQDV
ncbi:MAG: IPTL-CTERM sorting domain-containing protein [Dehalococcoidia bacterium]